MIIKFGKKITKNLGNYENCVIELFVEDSVREEESELHCLERLKSLVNENIKSELHNNSFCEKITLQQQNQSQSTKIDHNYLSNLINS